MILYCYDEFGVYTGPVSPALSPARPFVGGKPNYLRPARSTDQAPPEASQGFLPVFGGSAWTLAEDHRGQLVFNTVTRQACLVGVVGPVPEGFTALAPPSDCHVWDGGQWIEDAVLRLEEVRRERNTRLTASDWTQLADVPLSQEEKELWSAYRQALRDYPSGWTIDKSWPEPPTE